MRREWLLLALALLLLVAVVGPPLVNLGRYQRRIVNSMSRSLGREVTLRSVTLRLLPAPAVVLTDVVVNEDPAFGAEPALRAPRVLAQLRLASLWRGRFEVSRVEFSDASINLVRDPGGRWNVGSVLLQASHVVNAPTGQRRAGPAPRFPYIEITDSRVNIKQGVEKLPYSLLNANLSMWLAEPEIWQLRLDGQPVRTDLELGLSDTGTLRVEGKLHRATLLGHMPLELHAEWAGAPLGQASRLLLGRDPGWRGDLHAMADVAGDLDKLAIKTHVLIANLHREEFTPAEPFAVDATCHAAYSRNAHMLSDLACRWPVGKGVLLLTGSIASGRSVGSGGHLSAGELSGQPDRTSTLALTVQQLPASFLVAVAGLARSDFAPAFHLEGELSGMLFYNARGGTAPLYAGVLEASGLHLVAPGLQVPLEWNEARLAAVTPSPSGVSTLVLTTSPLDLGGAAPVAVNGQITAQGFLLHASGTASVARLEELGHATHLLPSAISWLAPGGTAEFDVNRIANWQQGAASPTGADTPGSSALSSPPPLESNAAATVTNGWLRLRDATYAPRFLPEAVLLPSAQATFAPGLMTWNVPAAVFHKMTLQISATSPLHCADRAGCATHFRASCGALDGEVLASAVLGTGGDVRLLDQLLGRLSTDSSRWPALDGSLHAESVTLGRLTLHNTDAAVSIADGRAMLPEIDAQALGGTVHGEAAMTIAGGIPHYTFSTVLTKANAAAAGLLFHENWGAGTLTVSSQLQLAGVRAEELASSAAGTLHAEWARGGLGTLTPLARFVLWTGDGRVENQSLDLTRGELTYGPSGAPLSVTGSIGFDRTLSLRVGAAGDAEVPGSSAGASVTVTGTLSRPGK